MPKLKTALLFLLGACTSTGPETTKVDSNSSRVGLSAAQDQSPSATDQFLAAHATFYRRSVLHPLVNVGAAYDPNGSVEGEAFSADMSSLALDVILTPPVDRDSFVIVGGLAEARRFQFTGVPAVADETLYAFALRLGYGTFLSEDLAVQGYWEPSLITDLDGTLTADDYQLGTAVVLAYQQQTANLFWKFGVALTGATDAGVAPVLGAVYHFDEAWILDALLPVRVDLHYRPNKGWDLTIGARLRANRYHVRGPVSIGAPENDIDVTEVVAFLAARHRFDAHLSTELELGSMVSGSYDLGYGNGQPDHGGSLKPSLTVAWQLSWEF